MVKDCAGFSEEMITTWRAGVTSGLRIQDQDQLSRDSKATEEE